LDPALQEGLRLFNARKFFEAHEALEALWLKAAGDEKTFLHGLIQVAAAFHHFTRGNLAGFRSLLEKGSLKLEKSFADRHAIRLAEFLGQLQLWREWAERADKQHLWIAEGVSSQGLPPLPEIQA
jgi:predicted metal-dependent hydrolase